MSDPHPDPVAPIVNAFISAMKWAFNPDDEFPPLGGGTEIVRFIAGNSVPLALWNAHAQGSDCQEPFLWVRFVRRFPSKVFPTPAVAIDNCDLPEVVHIEVGVGRCASLGFSDGTVDWDAVALESEVSLDDSRRMRMVMCRARDILDDYAFGVDTITQSGPDGGVLAWGGTAYVQI